MTEPAYVPPTPGMLSEQIDLPDLRMALGLLHIEGAGLRVVTWDGERLRHMAPAAARRFANDLEDGPFAKVYRPAVEGLRSLCDRIAEIEQEVAQRRADALAAMPVEGHA